MQKARTEKSESRVRRSGTKRMATWKRQVSDRYKLLNQRRPVAAEIRFEDNRPHQRAKQSDAQMHKPDKVTRPDDHRVSQERKYSQYTHRAECSQVDCDLGQAVRPELHEILRDCRIEFMSLG